MTVLVEACCDSLASARAAQAVGAGRIELCGPGDGGTTPSLGLIARTRDALTVPLAVMIRPRAGGFLYDDEEVEVMMADIVAAKTLGADAVVFGVLMRDGSLDADRLAPLVALSRPMTVTVHRAFDQTPDAGAALRTLVALGVDRVLTSGHATTALEGVRRLDTHVRDAQGRVAIMAGGRVRADHVRALVTASGVTEVHLRATNATVFGDVVRAVALA